MNDVRNASILILIFAAVLLLYALLLFCTGDASLIPREHAAKMKDKKAYARSFAGVLALVAAAPLIAGIVGLISGNGKYVFRVAVGGMVLAIAIGADLMKNSDR